MRNIFIFIFCLMPLLAFAEDKFAVEVSTLWGYNSATEAKMFVKKHTINIDDENNLNIKLNETPETDRHGDIQFNYYNKLLKPVLVQQQNPNDIFLHYLHFGSSLPLSKTADFWLSAGAGLTFFTSENNQFDDQARLSMSLGLHHKFKLNKNVNFRLESRMYGTYLNGNSPSFCQNQQCSLPTSTGLLIQQEVSFSINFTF